MEYSHKLRICSHVARATYSSTLGFLLLFFAESKVVFHNNNQKSLANCKEKLVTFSMYVFVISKCVFDYSTYSDIRIFG